MRRFLWAWVAAGMALVILGNPGGEAMAQDVNPVRVVQRRPFLRRGRLELAPSVGLTLNDAMIRHYATGGNLNFHITEYLSIGANYQRTMGAATDLYDKVQNDYSLIPRVTEMDSMVAGQVGLALMYGKFALFNSWVIHFDTSLATGLGWIGLRGDSGTLGGFYGLGQRFFLTRWLTLDLGLRHVMFNDRSLTHQVMVTGGLGMFLPFDFSYKNEPDN